MNRIEYMRRLAALLQDVPVEERVAAMQYYNDYFDDAGEENEAQVIEELGSPEKVAAEMKAGLGRQAGDTGEFRETGYADTQFEEKEAPTPYYSAGQSGGQNAYSQGEYGQSHGQGGYTQSGQGGDGQSAGSAVAKQPWTNKWLKIALIILILIVAAPVLLPVVIGVFCVAFVLVIVAFCLFFALIVAAAAIALSGVALFVKSIVMIPGDPAGAVMVMGTALLLASGGSVATVAAVRVCTIVVPGMFRFCVDLCRRPFRKRKAVD